METTFTTILDAIDARQRRSVVVTWKGTPPDLSKETWEMGITNDDEEMWATRDKGLHTHYVFDLKGIEHARSLYNDLCVHFKQPERRDLFHTDHVNTGRRMFFLVKVILGKG